MKHLGMLEQGFLFDILVTYPRNGNETLLISIPAAVTSKSNVKRMIESLIS